MNKITYSKDTNSRFCLLTILCLHCTQCRRSREGGGGGHVAMVLKFRPNAPNSKTQTYRKMHKKCFYEVTIEYSEQFFEKMIEF